MAAEISDVATPPDHAEQQDGNPNTPSVVVLQPAAQPWGGDAESDESLSESDLSQMEDEKPKTLQPSPLLELRSPRSPPERNWKPGGGAPKSKDTSLLDPSLLPISPSARPTRPSSPMPPQKPAEAPNKAPALADGGLEKRNFVTDQRAQGAHMRTISALSGIDPGEADAHGLLSDPSLLSLSLSQQPTTAQSTPVAISFKTHTNHHLVPALTQLLKQILEFEYLDDQGTSDPSIESPLNSVLDRLSAVAEDEKEAISVSEQAMDELESDIRSLSEWRMENFRLLKVAGDRRGGDSGPAGALKTMELDDLISENKCLWEKIEAQQLSIKHLQAADWGRERNIQGKDHLIEVLKAQKLVLEQKIKRLAARTGLRAYTTPAPGRESAHHTC